MYWKNDWLSYGFDGDLNQKVKPYPTAVMHFDIKKTITRPIKTFSEELLLNAQAITERFPGTHDLMLSGGVDSEIVLRCHKILNIPINVFVAKYTEGVNELDFYQAMETCRIYDVKPTIIDLDLRKFYESGEAYDFYSIVPVHKAGDLIHLKIISMLDNMPILADGINIDSCYYDSSGGSWRIKFEEKFWQTTSYGHSVDRPIIPKWHDYSPELTMSILNFDLIELDHMHPPPWKPDRMEQLKYIMNNHHLGVRIRDKLGGCEGNSFKSDYLPPEEGGLLYPEYMRNFPQTDPAHVWFNNQRFSNYEYTVQEFKELM